MVNNHFFPRNKILFSIEIFDIVSVFLKVTLSRSSPSFDDSSREVVIVADFSFVLFNDCKSSLFSKIFPVALAKSYFQKQKKLNFLF